MCVVKSLQNISSGIAVDTLLLRSMKWTALRVANTLIACTDSLSPYPDDRCFY